MHQKPFGVRARWGSLERSPDPLASLRDGHRGKREREVEEGDGVGEEWRGERWKEKSTGKGGGGKGWRRERMEERKGGKGKMWGGKGDGRVGKEVGEGLAIVQF